ncbi:la-related protein 7-like isoform X2 [Corticium candelabrum]|uniref:la-related protein 7-like isoform X2 n=1 Tax=Corticium candelabrum TaxID=121492 RepID=UPI002E26BFB3|nr:la-related protein 7-like isoform X2 [Corticium candelabrum]
MNEVLSSKLQKQIQFYFSDANLRHDRFLRNEISESEGGYVSVETIAQFNVVKSLAKDLSVVQNAIQQCPDLELSGDGLKVRRISGLPEQRNVDEQTIFVDNLPPHADHAMVKELFETFGKVDYISLPRYLLSGKPKGFAFVEFSSNEFAANAVKAFEKGGDMALHREPVYSNQQKLDEQIDCDGRANKRRRKRKRLARRNTEDSDDNESSAKRVALDSCNLEKLNPETSTDQSCMATKLPTVNINCKGDSVQQRIDKEMEGRLRVDISSFRVISKMEWLTLKQLYKKLQRKGMGQMKQQLRDRHPTKSEQSASTLDIGKGTIIRIEGDMEEFKPKTLKDLFASVSPVAYVDILPGAKKGYVRFCSQQGVNRAMIQWQEKNVPSPIQDLLFSTVKGQEEESYIEKAIHQREERFSCQSRERRKRGKDKWLSKAERVIGSGESERVHTRFDDDSTDDDCNVTTSDDVEKTSGTKEENATVEGCRNRRKHGRKQKKSVGATVERSESI